MRRLYGFEPIPAGSKAHLACSENLPVITEVKQKQNKAVYMAYFDPISPKPKIKMNESITDGPMDRPTDVHIAPSQLKNRENLPMW